MPTKIKIPNYETGSWEEKKVPNTGTRIEKDDNFINFFNQYATKIINIESELETIKQKDIESSNRNIEILALFVALFTFISIETQILRSGISFITAVGFSLLILGGLMFFIFSLSFSIKRDKDWMSFVQYFVLLLFSFLILASGLFFIQKGNDTFSDNLDDKYYNKVIIDQKIITESAKPLDTFKKCVLSAGAYWPCLK
jgi:hypothetical protein